MDRRNFLALPLASRAFSQELLKRLHASIERIESIDTHEHILPEAERVKQPLDFFVLAGHYAMNDLVSAGLPKDAQALINSPGTPVAAKWSAFEPYWKYARSTGYGDALRIAIREVYGVQEISLQTLPRINEAIAAHNKPGLYRDILRTRGKIRFCVNDEYWQTVPQPPESDLFVVARKFDAFVMPVTPEGVKRLEKLADTSIADLAGLKRAMEKHFDRALKAGMAAVKSTAAYERGLRFEEVSENDAQRDFERLVRGEEKVPEGFRRLANRPYRRLADHMFHHLVRLADANRLPVQIHTGLQAGNGNFVENTRPSLLTNLFLLYPRVPFDLFHIGYPYQHETAVLAKTFPNVYADFCWMHVVSPEAARSALSEMLDAAPANKIFGFGGDYRYPELSYAHLLIARRNIATVLTGRVQAGRCTEEEAAELAQWLLHDNPARLFTAKRKG